MHMSDGWIVVVRQSVLEIYIPNEPTYKFWRALSLAHSVGFASISLTKPRDSADRQSVSLRLCITCTGGIFVYDVLCDPKRDIFSVKLIWHYRQPKTDTHRPTLSRGALGITGESISWLHGSTRDWDFAVRFATARLPIQHESSAPPVVYEWHDDEMPALYAQGIYDYDETRGILILGNLYGELSLYDFSGSDPHIFRNCSSTKLMPTPRTDQKVLPTVRVLEVF